MIEVGLRVTGLRQTLVRVRRLEMAASDLRPALERIADRFREHLDVVFATEGAATKGGRWAPLSERYAEWKRGRGYSPRILQRTQALRQSLTRAGAPGHVVKMNRRTLTVGSEIRVRSGRRLLQIHQEGRGVPVRRIIDPPDAVIAQWRQELREHLDRAYHGAGVGVGG